MSICAKDSGGPYDHRVTTALVEAAKAAGAAYAVDVYPHYGSDAEAALRAGYDVRHGLIGRGGVRLPRVRALPQADGRGEHLEAAAGSTP